MDGQGVIPNDWEGEYCRYAVCWPNSPKWLAVLRGVLTWPARGRFWQETTGTITEAQAVIRETFDNNLHLEEVIVACGDEALAKILALALRNSGSGCCSDGPLGGKGSAGATGEMPPLLDIEEGDPDLDEPPEGFEDWEDFFNQKCGVANDILGKLENSLEAISIISFGTLGLDALAFSLSIAITLTVPPATIIAIAAFLIGAYGVIIVTSLLSIISENKEDLVCELYNGTSPESSLANFHTLLGTLIDSVISDVIQNNAAKQVAHYFVNNSVANALYEKDLTKVWPTQDCSTCGEETCGGCLTRVSGALVDIGSYDVGGTWGEVIASNEGGYYLVAYIVNTGQAVIEWQNLTGYTATGGGADFVISDETYLDTYAGNSFSSFQALAEATCIDVQAVHASWAIASSTPFTVEIKTSVC